MIIHIILLFLFLIDKTPATMAAFALIPSQVPGAKHIRQPTKLNAKEDNILQTNNNMEIETDSDSAGDEVVYSPPQAVSSSASVASTTSSTSSHKRRRKKITIPRTGNLPDINWRAISMTHLRAHPNFQPLPPPSMIDTLPTKEHVRYFRQESWQWDYLHVGRCTTSQASAALGFLEPKAASFLGIPKSLQRGGTGAWNRLSQTVPENEQSLEAMEQILCEGRSLSPTAIDIEDVVGWRPGSKEADKLWIPASRIRDRPFPFTAKYRPNLTIEDLYERKLHLQHHNNQPNPMKVRMSWGNSQEATSVLTALNYFCGIDECTVIHEVGMCGSRYDDMEDEMNGVKIGATPDALIHYADGTVEVLEVKNHCPFVLNKQQIPSRSNNGSKYRKKKKGGKKKKQSGSKKEDDNHQHRDRDDVIPKSYLIRDFQLEQRVPPVYIPQLMMEMYCTGDNCNAATMVRQTATKGAILLRLKRCEHWIEEMKYFLGKFQTEFVKTTKCPSDNFFWSDDSNSRYHKFLQSTKDLSESVEQVAYIEHAKIQRMVLERGAGRHMNDVPLFLDRVYMDEE